MAEIISCDKSDLANKAKKNYYLSFYNKSLLIPSTKQCWLSRTPVSSHRTWWGMPYSYQVTYRSVNIELTIFIFYTDVFWRSRHYHTVENASEIFNNRDNVSAHRELINACI